MKVALAPGSFVICTSFVDHSSGAISLIVSVEAFIDPSGELSIRDLGYAWSKSFPSVFVKQPFENKGLGFLLLVFEVFHTQVHV